ncbi:MAG TPA: hypothetical protein VJ754_02195, partial [Anaerolineae bacterium]|nr:hypothetical protein [Anaerolineae bacterium]
MRERAQSALPYVVVILLGLSCVLVIVLSAVGTQRLGWWPGAQLQSDLEADYNLQPEFTLAPVDATQVALLQATDEAGLQLTAQPGTLATVSVGLSTPGGTPVAQVTRTPTPSPTATPT